MATLRLRYVHDFVDKTGRVRFYFRYRGQRWPLPGQPGSAEFGARYDELWREHVVPRQADNVVFAPTTLGWVIEQYLGSDASSRRRAAPRRDIVACLTALRKCAAGR
jgi:hypothetical protein